mgnify:FL=1
MKIPLGFAVIAVALIMVPGMGMAQMGCPDLELSTVIQEVWGESALLVLPDGSGPPLTDAYRSDRTLIDATIFLNLYSSCPPTGPMAGYPAEDMWLESTVGNLVFCPGGSIADGPTDGEGSTWWSGALSGGGWDSGSMIIRLATGDTPGLQLLPLLVNSPDLNGDLTVNLQDVALFAEDFFSAPYELRSDLHFDRVINLSDLSVMTGKVGKTCP